MSQTEQLARRSPFSLRKEDGAKLELSDGFQIVRKFLANQQQSAFCEHHLPTDKSDEDSWLLHRDITHALILPILQIYRQAFQLAESFLCTHSAFDLELAFQGEARGAFSWLQCLIAEEEDWCSTRGCPACVVTHVLQSEPTIRLVLVACRLSRSLRKPKTERKLPLFDFWRSSLRRALDSDPFWGPSYSKEMEERAAQLEVGIQQLITQCSTLSQVVSNSGDRDRKSPSACFTPYHEHNDRPTIRRSSMSVSEQIRHSQPEQVWMEKIVMGCWTTLLADATQATETTESCLEPQDMSSSAMAASI